MVQERAGLAQSWQVVLPVARDAADCICMCFCRLRAELLRSLVRSQIYDIWYMMIYDICHEQCQCFATLQWPCVAVLGAGHAILSVPAQVRTSSTPLCVASTGGADVIRRGLGCTAPSTFPEEWYAGCAHTHMLWVALQKSILIWTCSWVPWRLRTALVLPASQGCTAAQLLCVIIFQVLFLSVCSWHAIGRIGLRQRGLGWGRHIWTGCCQVSTPKVASFHSNSSVAHARSYNTTGYDHVQLYLIMIIWYDMTHMTLTHMTMALTPWLMWYLIYGTPMLMTCCIVHGDMICYTTACTVWRYDGMTLWRYDTVM